MLRGYFYPVKMGHGRTVWNGFRFALAIFSGIVILFEGFRADCGLLGIPFSREGLQRKMASEKQMRGGHLKSLTQKEAAAQMHNGLSIKTYFIRLQTASA